MSFEQRAADIAARIRTSGRGVLTMRREDLRAEFNIGRFSEAQANAVVEALRQHEIFVHPHPSRGTSNVRLYDWHHPVGKMAHAVVHPDDMPDTPLTMAAQLFARERAGRDLRSDDAPWIDVFDIFMQLVIGREPEGWEELRDSRHPSELARELAKALELSEGIVDQPSVFRIASAVCVFRPKRRRRLASEFASTTIPESALDPFIDDLDRVRRRMKDEYEHLLRRTARLLLGTEELPLRSVEVGVLGLRYRREDEEGSTS